MSLVALNVVKDLRQAFAGRGLTNHASGGAVRVHADAEQRIFVVLDPRQSKTILGSRNVENDNYFAEPLEQLARRGNALPHVTARVIGGPQVRLIDVSRRGAQVETTLPMRPGRSVTIRFVAADATLTLTGAVVRSSVAVLSAGSRM